jgi:hypothetical protein
MAKKIEDMMNDDTTPETIEGKEKPKERERIEVDTVDTGEIHIDLAETEGKEDDDKDNEPEDAKPSRRDRRRMRFDEARETAIRAEERAKALEAENVRLRELALRETRAPREEQKNQIEQYDEDLKKVRKDQQMIYEAYQGAYGSKTLTAEQAQQYIDRANELKEREAEILFNKHSARVEAGKPKPDPQAAEVFAIRMQYPDIFSDDRVRMYANGEFQKLQAMGQPNNRDTLEKAIDAARRYYRLGQYKLQTPTAAHRAMYTSAPRGNGGEGRSSEESSTVVKVTPAMRKMANSFAPHIKNEEARIKHWMKSVGSETVLNLAADKK